MDDSVTSYQAYPTTDTRCGCCCGLDTSDWEASYAAYASGFMGCTIWAGGTPGGTTGACGYSQLPPSEGGPSGVGIAIGFNSDCQWTASYHDYLNRHCDLIGPAAADQTNPSGLSFSGTMLNVDGSSAGPITITIT